MNDTIMETQGAIPALHLAAVKKAFGATEIIRGVNWEVAQGECHVLIGPNGAGKSTLFGLISGHLPQQRHHRPVRQASIGAKRQQDQSQRPGTQLPDQ